MPRTVMQRSTVADNSGGKSRELIGARILIENRENMNEIIDYIKDSPIEYAIDALSVNYVIQTIVQMVLFPFVLYFVGGFLKDTS